MRKQPALALCRVCPEPGREDRGVRVPVPLEDAALPRLRPGLGFTGSPPAQQKPAPPGTRPPRLLVPPLLSKTNRLPPPPSRPLGGSEPVPATQHEAFCPWPDIPPGLCGPSSPGLRPGPGGLASSLRPAVSIPPPSLSRAQSQATHTPHSEGSGALAAAALLRDKLYGSLRRGTSPRGCGSSRHFTVSTLLPTYNGGSICRPSLFWRGSPPNWRGTCL